MNHIATRRLLRVFDGGAVLPICRSQIDIVALEQRAKYVQIPSPQRSSVGFVCHIERYLGLEGDATFAFPPVDSLPLPALQILQEGRKRNFSFVQHEMVYVREVLRA